MKIPMYWAHETQSAQDPDGKWYKLESWQWSDESTAQAAQRAEERVRELVARVVRGDTLERYPYGVRALREEILSRVQGDQGDEIGVITRNGYGAAVLNTTRTMFIDLDFDDKGPSPVQAIQKLFGKAKAPSQEEQVLARLEQWVAQSAAQNPGLGLRVYRTAAGMRGLVTSSLFDPAHADTQNALRQVGCDPLYVRLCRDQACFRARLTPKPWRCGVARLPVAYPCQDAGADARYHAWVQSYEAQATRYATCRLVRQIGNPEIHPEVARVLAIHDQWAMTGDGLPLA